MLTVSVFLLVVISVVLCQIDGDFWWLKNDFTKLKQGTIPPPKFDDVNELDTDETVKVVFRDSEGKAAKSLGIDEEKLSAIHFRDETELAKPFEFSNLNVNNKIWERPLKQTDVKQNISSQNTEDEFRFVFPSDANLIWNNSKNDIKSTLATEDAEESSNQIASKTKISSQNIIVSDVKNSLLPENICTFVQKSECIRNEGTLYEPWIKSNVKIIISDTQIVCCILPITTTSMSKIIFPDDYWGTKRNKRSNADNENPAGKQRNNLMRRRYTPDGQQSEVTTPSTRKRINQKITTSNENPVDPYWNIKNYNIRNPNIPSYQDPDTGSDYGSQSYDDDYAVELPKPGLLGGIYSDHKPTQSTWAHNKNKGFYYDTSDSVEEEEFETSFGYSTIDPRRDHRFTTVPLKKIRPKPLKLTAASSRFPEASLQNPTITFHSNPDFQVLQGFKLLNLMRNKNRFVRKAAENNKECAHNGVKMEEKPQKFLNYVDNEDDLFEKNLKQKLFNECGKMQKSHSDCENGNQGVVEFGGHPWIALVVLTKSDHSILCYATIVHSRVAVSIADCVHGQSPGTVSIIAGVRNLDDDISRSQSRMATITLDPNYTPGNLENNLALLHWLRPLTLDARVQPACLGDYHTEDVCMFVGWGGYDQEMHSDLQWQRASILAPRNCNERLSKLELSDALCAAVHSRGTVTGVGGPLMCKNNERWSVVGVAVWRDDVVIVLPQREWVIRNMISLRIE